MAHPCRRRDRRLWLLAAAAGRSCDRIIGNPILAGQTAARWLPARGRSAARPGRRRALRSAPCPWVPFAPLDPLGGAPLHRLLGHRGPLHSLPGLAVFGLLSPCRCPCAGAGSTGRRCCWATARHLALDAMTRHGIPLLPATRPGRALGPSGARRHLLAARCRFVTGSAAEDVLQALLFGAGHCSCSSRTWSDTAPDRVQADTAKGGHGKSRARREPVPQGSESSDGSRPSPATRHPPPAEAPADARELRRDGPMRPAT